MSGRPVDDRALRREALVTRAQLQRIEVRAALEQLGHRSGSARAGALALALARSFLGARGPRSDAAVAARPWMLSAGVLALKALRASPTARWVVGAAAVGAAVWWVARTLSASEAASEDGGDDESG